MPSSQSRRPPRVYGRPEDTQRDAEQGYRKRMAVYSRNLHRAVPETSIRTCISKSPELVRQALAGNRCRAWVRRDIEVILDTTDTAIFEELIVSAIRESGSLDCRVVGPRIEPILGSYTDIFIDELAAFVNSTLPMETYDRYIVYDTANSAK
ncbi:hypothetical protein FBU59_001802 [Linderina macrospora]|uniref:Uncharacterized protein n=1 Tax=Linderina macrospora TaxID=4868 RepID=A0ACC1JD60_9FUNG|nr:hypothetical protein FBU59_001802 [Linderina macrospora]